MEILMTHCLNTLCLALSKYAIFDKNDPGNFSPPGIWLIADCRRYTEGKHRQEGKYGQGQWG